MRYKILDENATVHAIAERAEVLLGVDERAGVHAQVDEFLRPANGNPDNAQPGRLLRLAVAGSPPLDTLQLRAVEEPQRRYRAARHRLRAAAGGAAAA